MSHLSKFTWKHHRSPDWDWTREAILNTGDINARHSRVSYDTRGMETVKAPGFNLWVSTRTTLQIHDVTPVGELVFWGNADRRRRPWGLQIQTNQPIPSQIHIWSRAQQDEQGGRQTAGCCSVIRVWALWTCRVCEHRSPKCPQWRTCCHLDILYD